MKLQSFEASRLFLQAFVQNLNFQSVDPTEVVVIYKTESFKILRQ